MHESLGKAMIMLLIFNYQIPFFFSSYTYSTIYRHYNVFYRLLYVLKVTTIILSNYRS